MSQKHPRDDAIQRRPWDDVRKDFLTLVCREGVDETALCIHVHRTTIYRLISGKTKRPSGPLRVAVENIVADATPPEGRVEE